MRVASPSAPAKIAVSATSASHGWCSHGAGCPRAVSRSAATAAAAAARERAMIRTLDLRPPPADHAMRQRRTDRDGGVIGGIGEPAHLRGADQLARAVEREIPAAADEIERDRERDLVAALRGE